eukprot:scaffold7755_cov104-Cylindrotheca_fusiformis.AAC.18
MQACAFTRLCKGLVVISRGYSDKTNIATIIAQNRKLIELTPKSKELVFYHALQVFTSVSFELVESCRKETVGVSSRLLIVEQSWCCLGRTLEIFVVCSSCVFFALLQLRIGFDTRSTLPTSPN